jgi:hypothetical protein
MSHLIPLIKGNPSTPINYTVSHHGLDFKTGEEEQGKGKRRKLNEDRYSGQII